jgi:hypothetical protein
MKADAFISHASADAEFAEAARRALRAGKLKAWIDDADIRFGALLRDQIQSAIADSRVLVLIWSKAASRSRWVMAEMFTAFYLDRFIIPCVLDRTPLPQFLANVVRLDPRREKDRLGKELCRAVRAAPAGANDAAAVMVRETAEVRALINDVAAGQYGVLAAIVGDRAQAAKANGAVEHDLRSLQALAPLHPMVLNLAGYQRKNDYMIRHWDAIQAGRAPKHRLLKQGERNFFDSLCVDPFDESAINGLGNILFFQRELDAAEFFHRRAVDVHRRRTGKVYAAAKHDLDMVVAFKREQAWRKRK